MFWLHSVFIFQGNQPINSLYIFLKGKFTKKKKNSNNIYFKKSKNKK